MALRPEVFVSAAAPEFNALRKVVKHALLEIGARPAEQGDFSYEYGPLHGVLTQLLGKCGAVIHLLGHEYGQEPAERTLHAPRRSFTHYELDVAQKLGLPIYTFVAGAGCELLPFGTEEVEAQQLQAQHRAAFLQGEEALPAFTSPEELGRLVRGLRRRLIVRRSLVRLPGRPLAERFVGRARLLEELMPGLTPGSLHLLQPVHSLQAMGGAGVSTLALEMAWRLHEAGRMDFIFWLPAGMRTEFEASLASLARTDSLALVPDEVASHRARLHAVREWFRAPEHAGRFLVIVDGVETEAAWWSLRSFLPLLAGGAVVLTGRPPPGAGLLVHTVAPFSQDQAQAFVLARLGFTPAQVAAEGGALERLTAGLGRVPLAMALLQGHLVESKLTPRALLAALTDTRHQQRGQVDLATLFDHTAAALDETGRALLRQLVSLAPEPAAIPLAIFEHRGDWPLTNLALAVLERRGLLQRDESTRTIRLHRTIRELARDRLLLGPHTSEALGAVRPALEAALQRAAATSESANPGLRELLIPHCRALLGQLNGHPLEIHAAPLARGMAEWLTECGRPGEAEVFCRRALTIEERRLGPAHAELAARLRELAALLRALRRLGDAETALRRAWAIDAEATGEDSAEVATDLHLLSACLCAAGRLGEAETLGRQAWAMEQRHAGPVHPKVANAMHRVAGILEAARRPQEARALYGQALAIDETAFGPAHPRVAVRYYHLGRLLGELGRAAEGVELFERGLALEEQRLGRDHVELAPIISEYAVLLEGAGRSQEAAEAYRRVVRISETFLGPEHPETLLAQAGLANFLHENGGLLEALALFDRALAGLSRLRSRWRGDHPHLRSVLTAASAAWRAQGRSEQECAAMAQGYSPRVPRRERSRFLEDEEPGETAAVPAPEPL